MEGQRGQSSELTRGPESECEGVRMNVNPRVGPTERRRARVSAGVRGTPAAEERQRTTPLRALRLHQKALQFFCNYQNKINRIISCHYQNEVLGTNLVRVKK